LSANAKSAATAAKIDEEKSPSGPVRGRGRKKFEDSDSLGVVPPDLESGGAQQQGGGGGGGISSSDRADAQKQFSHMLEIHSFPTSTTTEDLNKFLEEYATLYRLKWVNDNSALAIFKSPKFATDALSRLKNSTFKIRSISEASEESLATASKALAKKVEEKVTPRPYKTTTTVARRLIANALNLNIAPTAIPESENIDHIREVKRRVWEDEDL